MFALLFGDQMTSGRILLNEVKNRLRSVWSLFTSESAGWLAGAIKQCLVKITFLNDFRELKLGLGWADPQRLFGCKVMQINSSFESFLQLSFKVRCNFGISIADIPNFHEGAGKFASKKNFFRSSIFLSQTFPPWKDERKKVAESVSRSGDKY